MSMEMRTAYIVGVGAFAFKGAFALTISYWVASTFAPADFALWSIFFSIGIVLSVADLGVGQYVLTLLSDERVCEESRSSVISNAFFLICHVACLFFCFSLLFIFKKKAGVDPVFASALIGLMMLRVVVIAHGAYLQSIGRYHERKLLESLGYGGAFAYTFFRGGAVPDIQETMLVVNGFITVAALAVGGRAVYLGCPSIDVRSVRFREMLSIMKESLPYFLNNSSGLLIYGGFITVSSFLLSVGDLAKLALFHSMVFTNAYQVYELLFRISQSKIKQMNFFVSLAAFFFFSLSVLIVCLVFGGQYISNRFFSGYSIAAREIIALSVYMFFELTYLLLMSRSQMVLWERRLVAKVSVWKTISFIGLTIVLYWLGSVSLPEYAICLSAWSALTLLVFCAELRASLHSRQDAPMQET